MSVLRYSFEACSTNSSDYRSLEHPVIMAFMKIFETNCTTVVDECHRAFGLDTIRRQILLNVNLFFSETCVESNNYVDANVSVEHAAVELEILQGQNIGRDIVPTAKLIFRIGQGQLQILW